MNASRFADTERVRFASCRSEQEAATAFVLAAEPADFLSGSIQDDAGQIRGLLRRRSAFEVDASRQTCSQITAFGIDRQIHGLQENRNGLRCGLDSASVLDGHREHAFAASDRGRKLESGAGVTGTVDGGVATPRLLTVHAGSNINFRIGGNAAFGAFDMETGGNHISWPVTIAHKNDLALETRSAIGSNIEFAFRSG